MLSGTLIRKEVLWLFVVVGVFVELVVVVVA